MFGGLFFLELMPAV